MTLQPGRAHDALIAFRTPNHKHEQEGAEPQYVKQTASAHIVVYEHLPEPLPH